MGDDAEQQPDPKRFCLANLDDPSDFIPRPSLDLALPSKLPDLPIFVAEAIGQLEGKYLQWLQLGIPTKFQEWIRERVGAAITELTYQSRSAATTVVLNRTYLTIGREIKQHLQSESRRAEAVKLSYEQKVKWGNGSKSTLASATSLYRAAQRAHVDQITAVDRYSRTIDRIAKEPPTSEDGDHIPVEVLEIVFGHMLADRDEIRMLALRRYHTVSWSFFTAMRSAIFRHEYAPEAIRAMPKKKKDFELVDCMRALMIKSRKWIVFHDTTHYQVHAGLRDTSAYLKSNPVTFNPDRRGFPVSLFGVPLCFFRPTNGTIPRYEVAWMYDEGAGRKVIVARSDDFSVERTAVKLVVRRHAYPTEAFDETTGRRRMLLAPDEHDTWEFSHSGFKNVKIAVGALPVGDPLLMVKVDKNHISWVHPASPSIGPVREAIQVGETSSKILAMTTYDGRGYAVTLEAEGKLHLHVIGLEGKYPYCGESNLDSYCARLLLYDSDDTKIGELTASDNWQLCFASSTTMCLLMSKSVFIMSIPHLADTVADLVTKAQTTGGVVRMNRVLYTAAKKMVYEHITARPDCSGEFWVTSSNAVYRLQRKTHSNNSAVATKMSEFHATDIVWRDGVMHIAHSGKIYRV